MTDDNAAIEAAVPRRPLRHGGRRSIVPHQAILSRPLTENFLAAFKGSGHHASDSEPAGARNRDRASAPTRQKSRSAVHQCAGDAFIRGLRPVSRDREPLCILGPSHGTSYGTSRADGLAALARSKSRADVALAQRRRCCASAAIGGSTEDGLIAAKANDFRLTRAISL